MTLRLITFDATGTIFKFKKNPISEYINVSKNYGISVNEAEAKTQFRFAMKKMNDRHPNFGTGSNLDSMKWWINVVQDTLHKSGDPNLSRDLYKPIAIHLYKLYGTASAYEVFDDFVRFARKLRSQHPSVTTGVISNFDRRLTSVLAQLGVAPFLDFVVFSEEAGVSKPDGLIFQAALRKVGNCKLKPREVLHIGDDVEKDYFGAKSSGWNSIVLNRKSLSSNEFINVPKADICKDFDELEKVFEERFI